MQLGRKVMMFMRTSDAAEIVDENKEIGGDDDDVSIRNHFKHGFYQKIQFRKEHLTSI